MKKNVFFFQSNNENLRSLEASDYMVSVAPASRKASIPTILRLYPSAGKVTPLHANLPLRFGRRSAPEAVRTPKSFLNLPQRFGRAQATDVSVVIPCRQCPRSAVLTSPSATLPQRFGRRAEYGRAVDAMAILLRGSSSAAVDSR